LIRPRGILSGKLINTVGFVMLLIIATFPLFGTSLLLVGLDWVQIARFFGILLVTVLSCAMIGILCSTWARRSITAILSSYVAVVFEMGGFLVVFLFLRIFFDLYGWEDALEELSVVCPPAVLAASLEGDISTAQYVAAICYQLAVFSLCWLWASRLLRRPAEPPKVETRDPIDDRRKLWERKHRFPFYLIDPLRRKKEIEDHRNPMLVKELRWGMLNRVDALIRAFYISMAAYFCLGMVFNAWAGVEQAVTLFIVQMIITLLIAPALLANTFTKEHEQGNYDMLRMTLLSPREVVMGKVRAGMVCMAPLALAVFVSNLPYMILVKGSLQAFFGGYVTLAVCCYLSLGISVLSSLLTTRTTTSLIISYVANAYAFIGLVVTLAIVTIVFEWNLDEATGCYLSPITAFAQAFGYRTLSEHRGGILTYWGSNMLLWYGIAWFFIRLTIAGYRRRLSDR
jgi:hypothetical protein